MIRMMKFSKLLSAALAASILSMPVAGLAETASKGAFDVYVRGIKAGRLAFSGIENGTFYSAVGHVESTGLLAAVVKVRYDARSKGRMNGSSFIPASYFEKTTGSRRNNESVMEYRSGVPQVKKYTPPRDPKPWDVPPKTQAGTLDPMTVLYTALKDVPLSAVCNVNVRMYDGKRASTVKLSDREPNGEGYSCNGEYRRIQGWHPKELEKKSRFPFRLTYAKVGDDLYRVTHVTIDTVAGRATLKRR